MNKALQIKIAHRLIKGLTICWTDDAALTDSPDIRDEVVSHTKPILKIQAPTIWRDYHSWIMERATLLWRVDITVVYNEADGERHDQRRTVTRGKLIEIAHACYPVIESVMADEDNRGKAPLETRFKVECLGDRSATAADYDDYEAA